MCWRSWSFRSCTYTCACSLSSTLHSSLPARATTATTLGRIRARSCGNKPRIQQGCHPSPPVPPTLQYSGRLYLCPLEQYSLRQSTVISLSATLGHSKRIPLSEPPFLPSPCLPAFVVPLHFASGEGILFPSAVSQSSVLFTLFTPWRMLCRIMQFTHQSFLRVMCLCRDPRWVFLSSSYVSTIYDGGHRFLSAALAIRVGDVDRHPTTATAAPHCV